MSNEYVRELTYELRHRGLTEDEIRDVLRELPSRTAEELDREFGSPSSYAQSFPKGDRRTAGSIILSIAVAIALIPVTWRVVSVLILGADENVVISLLIFGGGAVLGKCLSIAFTYPFVAQLAAGGLKIVRC